MSMCGAAGDDRGGVLVHHASLKFDYDFYVFYPTCNKLTCYKGQGSRRPRGYTRRGAGAAVERHRAGRLRQASKLEYSVTLV